MARHGLRANHDSFGSPGRDKGQTGGSADIRDSGTGSGRNEGAAIQVCLAYVDAQREYATKDRDTDGLLEYAHKFISTPGEHDGLYWETREGEAASPLGPLSTRAKEQGYVNLEPYHG